MDYINSIRNFCIISHIDHGKSTLADRLLELTETVRKEKMQNQYLDMMDLEREKGITIKMQPCRMAYRSKVSGSEFVLNLIDTPGHIDFSYEVSRSLAAVEGAVLLVDAVKGIQAQTLANLEFAKKQNLTIIPAVNKIDLPNARTEEVIKEIENLLSVSRDKIIKISAKKGINIEEILEAIIERIPPPKQEADKPFQALIFDSKYDSFKGVIVYARVFSGRIEQGQKIYLAKGKIKGEIKELGFFKPQFLPQEELKAGEIGYIATGIKEIGNVRVGDTILIEGSPAEILPGYQEPKPVVFASLYPQNSDDFDLLKKALQELKLNDAALVFEVESREFLGRGFRCGFLGSLHLEIITERLSREFGLDLIISSPSVIYKIINGKGKENLIYSAADWPDPSEIKEISEPWVKMEIIVDVSYLGSVFEILKNLKGKHIESRQFAHDRTLLVYESPLREIITDFYNQLLNQTQGFGSLNYEHIGYRNSDLVKIDILLAGKKEEAFSKITLREKAFNESQKIVKKIKEALPPQQFPVAIQAALQGKIIARETVKATRKDVTDYLYGGDYSRKRKLLEKQKKGKKKLKEKGEFRIPQKVFLEILKG